MKFALMFLLLTQVALGETIRQKQTREEMLTRVDKLISQVHEVQTLSKGQDTEQICKKIDEIFKAIPDHLIAIGTKMDLMSGKIMKMEQDAKGILIYSHQKHNICENDPRDLDLKQLQKSYKKFEKTLKAQKKRIKKADLGYSNSYEYYYEFE